MPANQKSFKTDDELKCDELLEELQQCQRTIARQKGVIARYEHVALLKRYPRVDHEEERREETDGGLLRNELDEALIELEAQNEELEAQNEELRVTNEALEAAKDSLGRSEANLRRAEKLADLGYWDWDLITNRVKWSDGHFRMFGYPVAPGTETYEMFRARVHPEDIDALERTMREGMDKDTAYNWNYRLLLPDGSIRYVHAEADKPIKDASGKPVRWFGIVQDVTARKQDEEALRASEGKYRGLVEKIADGIWELDKDYRAVYASPQFFDILGYTAEETLGKTPFDFMASHEAGRIAGIWAKGIESGDQPLRFEAEGIRRDGQAVFLEVNCKPIFDDLGEFRGYRGVLRDITERKHAEQALATEKRRFESLADNTPDVLCRFDRELRHLYANPIIEDITGITVQQYLGKTNRELGMPPHLCDQWDSKTQAVFESREPQSLDFSFPGVDGKEHSFEMKLVPEFSDNGSVETVLSIARDITERKYAEEERERLLRELASAREHLESVIENMPAGVMIAIAPSARIIMSNKQCEKILGHPNIVPVKISDYIGFRGFHPDGSRILPKEWPLVRSITKGEVVTGEDGVYQRGDGSKICTLSYSSPIRDEGGEVVAAVLAFLDITDRNRTEKKLAEAKAQAELYLDLMGHDINNMNQSAMGYLELALESLEMDGKIGLDGKILVEKPLQAIQNSTLLIDNVRKLQRLMTEGITRQPVDLHDLFEDLKARDFHASEKTVTVNVERIPHYLAAGNELLRDVFYNLISNSVKHSRPNKPVTVDVKAERVEESGAVYYRCVVEDNGPGIPDELKPRLFHRFQRGKTKAHGKGLGLYIVRTLVEGYGGRVWVEDRVPGDHMRGARFVVMLPTAGVNYVGE